VLTGFLAGLAQFAKQQVANFGWIVRELKAEIVRRGCGPGLDDDQLLALDGFERICLTPFASLALGTSP
jgi:hypothetical protein